VASPEPCCVVSSRAPLLRPGPACARSGRSRALRVPSLLGFLLPRTPLRRVPRFTDPAQEPFRRTKGCHTPRRCRPQGSCPSRRFRLRTRHARTLADPPFAVAPRRFAALFHAARVPGTTLQSFPFPRSRTRSRGPRASLRVSLSDCRRRRAAGIFAIAFPAAPALCLRAPPKRCSRRMSRDESSLRSLGDHLDTPLSVARTIVPSRRHWARRLAAGTPASKPCSPRESVRSTTPSPGQGEAAASVLSWVSSPLELSPPRSRVRYLAPTHAAGTSPVLRTPPGTQPPRYVSEARAPTPRVMTPGSAGTQGL